MKLTLTAEHNGEVRSIVIVWRNFKPMYENWLEDLLFDLSSCASVWKEFWKVQKRVKRRK